MTPFRVGVTRDLLRLGEETGVDVGTGLLDAAPGVEWAPVGGEGGELGRDEVDRFDGLLLLKPRVTAATVDGVERLRIVARWGVGYDNIDVDACTRNRVVVTLAPDGVRRPMAVAMLTMVLALAANLVPKNDLMRQGRWDRAAHLGMGLTGRTLGLVGLGNIGAELLRLAAPLRMRHLVTDPFVTTPPDGLDIELVELPDLMRQADFVCVCCPYSPGTHHLLSGQMLSLLKPSAYVVNAARGPIVDEQALIEALRSRSLAGAALDVFEQEPLPADSPLRGLDNVILAPHSLGWTDELVHGNGHSAATALLEWSAGRRPAHVLNPDALDVRAGTQEVTTR